MNKAIKNEITRRNLLRFLSNSAVFLPFMRTLMETQAFGDVAKKRAVFYFYPCGTVPKTFHSSTTGSSFIFPASTKPLAAVQSDLIMLNNVIYDTGGGVGSRHQQGNNYGLSGCEGEISNVSIDTYLGQKFPAQIPVLRLGVAHYSSSTDTMHNAVSFSGAAPSGGLPSVAAIEDSPAKAFAALFGSAPTTTGTPAPTGLSSALKKSLLDANLEQIKGLQSKLGTIEQAKLDLHLSSVRELERRIQALSDPAATSNAQCTKTLSKKQSFPDSDVGKSENFDLVTDLQTEVAIQAMACGMTNVVFLTMSHGTSGVTFKNGKPAAGGISLHETSHYGRATNGEAIHTANQAYMMGKFAQFIQGMGAVKEGDKSLLYNSSLLAFSEISDGDNHNYANMGLVLAGQAGGFFKTGRCIDGNGYTHNNLLVSILQGMGLQDTKFGNRNNGKGIIPALTKA